ncbi:MAG TPA: LytTR family DNA-binding domain-containing protein [Lachnospiraceae bacterium]|nr:LytTR family DNA-binding domain-containing protein [Lachnospiraceae bacterium]
MKIRIWTDERYKEPEIVICTEKQTEYITRIRDTIQHALNTTLTGYCRDMAQILICDDIIRIYAEKDKVLAECQTGIYTMKEKLYELEDKLDKNTFIRISRSEIVNIRRVDKLDTSLTGTIKIYLEGGIITYVSRRNVSKIKDILG